MFHVFEFQPRSLKLVNVGDTTDFSVLIFSLVLIITSKLFSLEVQ
jgi:hypothetical protein